jgi:uncharacterized RDD family membrane protein YckC
MTDFNPYRPPLSNLSVPSDAAQTLAGRGQRLGAAIVDGIVMLPVMLPVMYLMGMFTYAGSGVEPPIALVLLVAVIGFVVFVGINYIPLSRNGQTVGKKVLGIRIADMQGNKPDMVTLLAKRYLPVQSVSQVPFIGGIAGLIDTLFIFRKDRRCVHDLVAGTQVLRVRPLVTNGK